MKISTYSIKVWRFLSMALVIASAGFTYSILPDEVAVGFGPSGQPKDYMLKSNIFYIAVGIILVNNVLIMSLAKRLLKFPANLLPIPNQTDWTAHREALNEHLQNWFYCIVASINTILALTLFTIGTVNSNQFKYHLSDFGWLFYLTVFMLLAILISLPIRLLMKPRNED